MMDKKSSAGERKLELLNEYHQLRLRVSFQHIDSLLTEVEHILADSQSDSPFNRYAGDTTPIQQNVAHDYVVRIRTAMARIMKEQGICFGEPRCGSRWAANTDQKIAVLRDAVIATLETRLKAAGHSVSNKRKEKEELINAFLEVGKSFEKILQRSFELGISDQAPIILKVTVDQITVAWVNRSPQEASQILATKITELIAPPIGQMEEEY